MRVAVGSEERYNGMNSHGAMPPDLVMVGSYDNPVVVLSVLVSILAAYAARALTERLRHARARAWVAWIVGGSVADGIGTWSMHYTGMLAFHLPVPVQYDWPMVVLSLVVGMLGSAAALVAVSRNIIGSLRALAASIFLGSVGISGLHYTAMAAITFTYAAEFPDLSHAVSISSLGILGISIVPVMVLVVALLTSLVDRLQKQSALLDQLFEQAPQAVALMSAGNRVVRVNREFTPLFG
jgi:NO-binding membrane sensor protein with MHYT domain